jgi:hypothetical protein
MLEWKAQILTLLVGIVTLIDQLEALVYNWNW